jgi:hypothetical protein
MKRAYLVYGMLAPLAVPGFGQSILDMKLGVRSTAPAEERRYVADAKEPARPHGLAGAPLATGAIFGRIWTFTRP